MSLGTAVQNVGDFYSVHYLESTFDKDLKDLKKHWGTVGAKSPVKRIGALSQHFFRAKGEALEVQELEKRISQNGRFEFLSGWHGTLLTALGYEASPSLLEIDGGKAKIPLLSTVTRNGSPWVAIVEAPFCLSEMSLEDGMALDDPLEVFPIYHTQIGNKSESKAEEKLFRAPWSKAIGKIFVEDPAPRWVMLLAGSVVLLFDREKYSQGRYLQFDFEDLLGRKEADSLLAAAALLSKETLCPGADQGAVLHDTLEENSHKFAYGVSEALQIAVREAIELIANEWVESKRRTKKGYTKVTIDGIEREVTAEDLRHESLVFVYRLLFCFFAEARGEELGILPLNDDIYRLGYSLDALRDLENVPLSEEAKEGLYFNEHLSRLFQIIYEGYSPESKDQADMSYGETFLHAFELKPLTATLFDPNATPLLSNSKLRNGCLQKVIRCLSITSHQNARSIGRVNYAELGINQLGAVYEGLLSYRGMFASEDLIQVKNKDEDIRDKKTASWFVPKSRLDDFKRDEVVRTEGGLERIYKQGEFILHLTGIDREKSASYYTPEVLTKCLVEEALRELLKDYTPADADKILNLKICEPAMGSGAFLNEATSQLAHKYLELKQKQLGKEIDVSRLPEEHRRVKHYLACRNVYGVDLNPTAVELGALSLWLGSVHRLRVEDAGEETEDSLRRTEYSLSAVPWFGLRLRAGNSIIGARRAVWSDEELRKGKHVGNNSATPRTLKPGEKRKPNEIYHFLVFDEEMVPAANENEIKRFFKDECNSVKSWRAKEVKPKWSGQHICELIAFSKLIDDHWEHYSMEREKALDETACTATVWPIEQESKEAHAASISLSKQEQIRKQLESTSGSFQRLKLVMDAWCSLWFYPVENERELPTREGWLAALEIILGSTALSKEHIAMLKIRLGFDIELLFRATRNDKPDTEAISAAVPWLGLTQKISKQELFFHWELSFSDVLSEFGEQGFDLVLGNPPWISMGWSKKAVICAYDPVLGVRKSSAAVIDRQCKVMLSDLTAITRYLEVAFSDLGSLAFVGSNRTYPTLIGSSNNLYKFFIAKGFELCAENGILALVHEEGILDDPGGGRFRGYVYPRLRSVFQFRNELQLFADIGHAKIFCIALYGAPKLEVAFRAIFNLFHPFTIENSSQERISRSDVPGEKDDDGKWLLRGHRDRFVTFTSPVLESLARAIERGSVEPNEVRLPRVHSMQILTALARFGEKFPRLVDIQGEYRVSNGFEEGASESAGLFVKQNSPSFLPSSMGELIVSGPHFYVGNPFNKAPRTDCGSKGAYDVVDLQEASNDYLPRAIFEPGDKEGRKGAFLEQQKAFATGGLTEVIPFRHVNRTRVVPSNERTLISSLYPSSVLHVDGVYSVVFSDLELLADFHSASLSIPCDFLTRVCGTTHCREDVLSILPLPSREVKYSVRSRMLRLTCLTSSFASLWTELADEGTLADTWSCNAGVIERSVDVPWEKLSLKSWHREVGLRSDIARRQALLEIDVCMALSLKIPAEELRTIYRIQFPVMRQYELADEYDQKGIRLPNTVRKTPGAKELRDARKEHGDEKPLTVRWKIDNGNQTVTKTFYPPFEKFDREEDYAKAYEFFKKRFNL